MPAKKPSAKEISRNAKLLLGTLNIRKTLYNCIAYKPGMAGQYFLIPSPTFNWDPRVEVYAVNHAECLGELLKQGFVVRKKYRTSNFLVNDVYILTAKGKRKGQQILNDPTDFK